MCLHTLRFYHPDCPHQSPVPTTGPNYIPPLKCALVLAALDFYHTQPSRTPEMYPPPCPSPCLPVWGNESCRGNVLCAFRAGKCDTCRREDELVEMAKWLVEQIRSGWVSGASAMERHLKVLELWRPGCEGEYERAERMLEVRGLLEGEREGEGFGEGALREVVRNVVMGRGQVGGEQDGMLAFWTVFLRRLGNELTYAEFKRLQSFLDGTPAGDEIGPATRIRTIDGKGPNEPANRSRGYSDLPLAGETGREVGKPTSKSTPATPLSSTKKIVNTEKNDTTASSSNTDAQNNQKEPGLKPPSTRLQTAKLLARVRRSLSLANQPQLPTSPIPSSPTLTAPIQTTRCPSPTPRQPRALLSHRPPRAPSLNRENACLGSSSAEHENICYEHHELGYAGPEQKEISVQAWMNGVDGPKWEDVMSRATEVSRGIREKLVGGDTREDWCGAGEGMYWDDDEGVGRNGS